MSAARSSSWLDQRVEPVARLDVEDRQVRAGRGLLRHQVAQRRVAVLVDRGVEADVLAAPGQQVDHPVDVHAELGGDLLRLGVAAQLALEGTAGAADLVELLDHVDGQPDDPGLLGDAAGDRLAHPPGGVGRELVALGVVELLDRADQAGVALLDQVEHRHLGAAVLAGDRHDQPQVGGDERVDGRGPPRPATRAPRGWRASGAPPLARPTRPVSSRCWAIRPASMVLESSTSVARRAGGCARSRRGTGRRCRVPRSRACLRVAFELPCEAPFLSQGDAPPRRPHSVQRLSDARRFPGR